MDRQAWLTACGAASGGLLGLTLVSPGWPLAAASWWAVTAAGMSLGAMPRGLTWAPPVRRRLPALPLVLVGGVAALPAALAAWNALLSG